jgi:phosphatidylserine/phosphatidylglycerophosphate/cardiolipin synthase-like enzyme
LFLTCIANARRFIYFEDQYLIDLEAAAALNAALPRLQHVTILIAASEITALPCKWTYRRDFINAAKKGLSQRDQDKLRVFQLITPPAPPPGRPNFGASTYVHAKTWYIDDEIAVIGSANVNRRGWRNDSEVNAFIFDDAKPARGALTFAQKMRSRLWAQHLSVPASSVEDGVASAGLWLSRPRGAKVMPYDPNADNDFPPGLCGTSLARSIIDPAGP